jgi:hypothetical protein
MWFKKRRRFSALSMLGLDELMALCSHLFLIGGSGSGKTSALKIIMAEIIDRGVGCVWGCVKSDEAENAISVINSTSMRDRLLHLVPGEFCFNFLSYELHRDGGTAASAARLLKRLNDQLMRTSGKESESFWENLFYQYLHFSIVICHFAFREEVTIEHVYKLINSTPSSIEKAKSPEFKKSLCFQYLAQAESRVSSASEQRLYEMAGEFILEGQLELGSKARSSAVSQCNALLAPFLLSPMYETVCGKSTFTPAMPLAGYCVVLDAPILKYQQAGMVFQSLITLMVIEEALRRSNPENVTAIVRDEYQMLISDPEFEALALSVARSHGLAFIAATQNIPLLQSAMGGVAGEQQMWALLANHNTQLVLANRCSVTNKHFSEAFGSHREQFVSVNETEPEKAEDFYSLVFGADNYRFSTNEQLVPRLTPDDFLSLKRGGKTHRYLVEAFLTQGGRTFVDGCPFKLVTFSQR